jgi:Lon protease-like protein
LNSIPLFPLNTVLFPEGKLPLRIFETRYLDLVSESLRTQSAFGICLITKGHEVGAPAKCHEIGTFAHIVDWEKGEDGLLGITVQGGQRFRILHTRIRKNRLMEGDVEIIDDNEDEELPVEYQLLSDLLRQIADKFKLAHLSEHAKYLDANWVGCRLAELLPFELDDKQLLLEIDDPLNRLEQIQSMLQAITPEQSGN